VIRQGNLLQLVLQTGRFKVMPSEKRGRCGVFSNATRLRMLKAIARVDWRRVQGCLMVTLTYPDQYAERSFADRTQDRYLWHRYLEKHLGRNAACLWRTEWQVRKSGSQVGRFMPHHHLLLLNVGYIGHESVRHWWRGILGCEGYLATDVRQAKDGEHAARYAAKYMSKPDSGSLDNAAYLNRVAGRSWGWKRVHLVPFHPTEYLVDVPPEVVDEAIRLAAEHWDGIDPNSPGSFSLLADACGRIFRALRTKALECESGAGYLRQYHEADDGPEDAAECNKLGG